MITLPNVIRVVLCSLVLGLLLTSCGPSEGTRTEEPAAAPLTKEALYLQGHRLYVTRSYDSALVLLQQAAALDSSYREPVADLASLHYDRAMAQSTGGNSGRRTELREAMRNFARLERLGDTDAATYERLCEIAVALDDDRTFLRYAKKNAEQYPFDRQYYNLGLAYFNSGDYQNVVKSQKEAAEKFRQSPYLGGFYRQLGRAYMKLERDQTAERTLEAGLKAVDARLVAEKRLKGNTTEEVRRLSDDRIAILQLLRRLHQTYRAADKLREVDRLLQQAGAPR